MTSVNKNLYPDLPDSRDENAKTYRLKKIEDIQSQILKERGERERLYKKIKRITATIRYVEYGVEALGGISGAVGIPAILGIITAPVGLVLEGTCIGAFGASVLLKYASEKLTVKAKITIKLEYWRMLNSTLSMNMCLKPSMTAISLTKSLH